MKDFYDAIYLSPHLDDAALSCGGQIYDLTARGKPVLIVTLMAGDPADAPASQFAQSLHQRWELESDVVRARQAEDIAACTTLGADWEHWDFLDCIYRVESGTNRPFYTSDTEIFGKIDATEIDLVGTLASRMGQLPDCNRIFAPLTLGNHVDHQLTRQAAERCFSVSHLYYYEDYPYARQFSAEKFAARDPRTLQSFTIRLTESAINGRIQAIQCFKSQLSTFFQDEEDLENQLRSFINSVGGERYWKVIQE
jgi:LmbE family N-acetylglucosaminyl deacetylase